MTPSRDPRYGARPILSLNSREYGSTVSRNTPPSCDLDIFPDNIYNSDENVHCVTDCKYKDFVGNESRKWGFRFI